MSQLAFDHQLNGLRKSRLLFLDVEKSFIFLVIFSDNGSEYGGFRVTKTHSGRRLR